MYLKSLMKELRPLFGRGMYSKCYYLPPSPPLTPAKKKLLSIVCCCCLFEWTFMDFYATCQPIAWCPDFILGVHVKVYEKKTKTFNRKVAIPCHVRSQAHPTRSNALTHNLKTDMHLISR